MKQTGLEYSTQTVVWSTEDPPALAMKFAAAEFFFSDEPGQPLGSVYLT